MSAALLGGLAGCLGLLATVDAGAEALALVRSRAPALAARATGLVRALEQLGAYGREPGAGERRRLLAGAAALAFAGTSLLSGLLLGLVVAAAAPWLAGRLLRYGRERYRRAVEADAAAIAIAVADALAGGHSLRSALGQAAAGLPGAGGRELRRTADELALGAPTETALEALRARVRSQALDVIVAACLLARASGGDLARLLRQAARSFEDEARVAAEARAATAQARFTGLIVALLPLGGALLAELASPGFVRGLAGSLLSAWLVGLALGMQVVAAIAIRRLGRVRQ